MKKSYQIYADYNNYELKQSIQGATRKPPQAENTRNPGDDIANGHMQ